MSEPTTSDRIRRAAMALFAAKGYQSTSIADILQSARANAGSLYHAYPNKQDLLLAVLRDYRDGIGEMLLAPAWAGIDDPLERIFALLGAYRAMLAASDCTYGCPIGSLALELHEPDEPVRELLAQNFTNWTAAVADCIRAAQAAGRLVRVDPGRLSRHVLAVMEGAVMQARTHRSLDPFDDAIAVLHDHFSLLEGGKP